MISFGKKLAGPVRSNIPELFVYGIEVEINGATITSSNPTATDFTIANAGTGDYTITFGAVNRPAVVFAGFIAIEEDLPLEKAHWTGYTSSTGVGTFSFYDGATEVATNFVGTAKLVLFCSHSLQAV